MAKFYRILERLEDEGYIEKNIFVKSPFTNDTLPEMYYDLRSLPNEIDCPDTDLSFEPIKTSSLKYHIIKMS